LNFEATDSDESTFHSSCEVKKASKSSTVNFLMFMTHSIGNLLRAKYLLCHLHPMGDFPKSGHIYTMLKPVETTTTPHLTAGKPCSLQGMPIL